MDVPKGNKALEVRAMRIHYNVTGDRRKARVKAIADATGAKAEYKGMPTA